MKRSRIIWAALISRIIVSKLNTKNQLKAAQIMRDRYVNYNRVESDAELLMHCARLTDNVRHVAHGHATPRFYMQLDRGDFDLQIAGLSQLLGERINIQFSNSI